MLASGGGEIGVAIATLALGFVGAASAPVIAIALVGSAVAGGFIGGTFGSMAGKATVDIIYEKMMEGLE